MTKKIMITQEQADAIESAKDLMNFEQIVEFRLRGFVNRNREALNDLELEGLVRALMIGYEVEPTYKVGDWVVPINVGLFLTNETATQLTDVSLSQYVTYGGDMGVDKRNIRHATPEEVKAEKERRLWKTIGREVNEFREGDIRMTSQGALNQVHNVGLAVNGHVQYGTKGFYPAESFISFEEGEGE